MRCPPRIAPSRRPGFTMIELMVVIVIIAILTALLLPAIAAAVAAANNARVSAEQQNLQTALASFKNLYGEYPPSRIILYNLVQGTTAAPYGASTTAVSVGAIPGSPDLNLGDLNQRTVRAMRKYFPRATPYFPTTGTATVNMNWSAGTNATNNGYVILDGDECLVFFLGGMAQAVTTGSGGGWGMIGFNRDPVNPFLVPTAANPTQGANSRTTPLFEFAAQRLVDLDGDGFPSYIDPLSANEVQAQQRPYAYFSAYGNNGYDPNDCNFGEVADDGSTPVVRSFYVNFAEHGGTRVTASGAPNPYTIGDADPKTTANPTPQSTTWVNPQTFQIISAGRDGFWGLGGPYDGSSSGARLPLYTATNDAATYGVLRTRERDNITNFAGGKLD